MRHLPVPVLLPFFEKDVQSNQRAWSVKSEQYKLAIPCQEGFVKNSLGINK